VAIQDRGEGRGRGQRRVEVEIEFEVEVEVKVKGRGIENSGQLASRLLRSSRRHHNSPILSFKTPKTDLPIIQRSLVFVPKKVHPFELDKNDTLCCGFYCLSSPSVIMSIFVATALSVILAWNLSSICDGTPRYL
jgi:hypothetical protein